MSILFKLTILILITFFATNTYAITETLFEEWSLDLKDPIIYLENEIKTNPNNYRLRFVLGALYFELGVAKVDTKTKDIQANLLLLDKAEKEFKEVLKIKKDYSLSYYYLGHIAMQKNANAKQAMEYYRKAIESDKQNYKAYLKLHFLYLVEKRYKEAIQLLEHAKNNFGSNIEIYYRISLTYFYMGDYQKVIENAQKALLFGKSIGTQLILASAYSLSGNYDDAKKELEDVLITDPKNRTALLGISVVFSKTGKKEKAIEILKKALIYYPDDSEIKKMLKELE